MGASDRMDSGSRPAVKGTKVAVANVAEPVSTVTLFRDLAAGWITKEEDWYGKPQADYTPIDNQGKERVADDHLEKAVEEYNNRFVFSTEEEDAESHQYSGSPYLLVATNVKSTWEAPAAFSQVRFMLAPMQEEDKSALFITFMPGIVHGTIDGAFADEIGAYLKQNNLKRVVKRSASGGGTYQPDIRLFPNFPDPNPPAGAADLDTDYDRTQSRVVIEFEFGNRNADGLREVGHTVLSNEYGSLFIGIKIWKRTHSGSFGAALVVWEKNHITGVVTLREAFDFGTKELATATKNAWNKPGTANMLPRVPVNLWQRPMPLQPLPVPQPGQPPPPTPPGWSLILPRDSLLYRMPATAAAAQYLTAPALNFPDLSVDLKAYQGEIDDILD